ncbi:hypothetical protein D514_0111790 [Microbacterium sp. UCD-TDU]|nr:hypothetical protein D514_0111790 [Microbacterium sp. UCD-TDU]
MRRRPLRLRRRDRLLLHGLRSRRHSGRGLLRDELLLRNELLLSRRPLHRLLLDGRGRGLLHERGARGRVLRLVELRRVRGVLRRRVVADVRDGQHAARRDVRRVGRADRLTDGALHVLRRDVERALAIVIRIDALLGLQVHEDLHLRVTIGPEVRLLGAVLRLLPLARCGLHGALDAGADGVELDTLAAGFEKGHGLLLGWSFSGRTG